MTEARAKVHSIEVLESFRAALIRYLEKAGAALDEVRDEVVRTRLWLEGDRRVFWQNELRRRARELERRKQQLFSARISTLRDSTLAEQRGVAEAQQALAEAEAKLDRVKRWNRTYESRVEPLVREVDKLRHVLTDDLRLAVVYLAKTVETLDAYAELAPPPEAPASRVDPASPRA